MRNKNIAERIKLVLSSKNLSIRSFARAINCADTTIGNIVHDKSEPNYSTIFSILEQFPDISPEWLITGEGDKYVKNHDKAETYEEFYANHIKEITKIILNKLENYAESTPIESILSSVTSEINHPEGTKNQKTITQTKAKKH